jgi:hypothetical protein
MLQKVKISWKEIWYNNTSDFSFWGKKFKQETQNICIRLKSFRFFLSKLYSQTFNTYLLNASSDVNMIFMQCICNL